MQYNNISEESILKKSCCAPDPQRTLRSGDVNPCRCTYGVVHEVLIFANFCRWSETVKLCSAEYTGNF